ncbi:MAG: hypothetical protein LBJ23_02155, partial [Tannerella sp.]|nr:hypothetical protein [Tannerella sp.]
QFASLTDIIYQTWSGKTAKEISEVSNPETMSDHENVARRGGNIAKEARLKLEVETGKKVVTPLNAKRILSITGNKTDETI